MNEKELNSKIFSGTIWKFCERIIAQGVSFVVSLILARLLMPEDYGAISVINIFIAIADVLFEQWVKYRFDSEKRCVGVGI